MAKGECARCRGTRKTWMAGMSEPGHDEKANHFQTVGKSLKMLAASRVRVSGERSRTLSKDKDTYLFCKPGFMELLDEPVVELESDLLLFFASNTDIPCGPIVIKTGSPSFDLA